MGVYSETGTGPSLSQRLLVRLYPYAICRHAVQLFHGVKQPRKWVFIVGCYNSGTTLLQRLLSWHANISTLPAEGAWLTPDLPRPEDYGWTRMWCECADRIQIPPGTDRPRAKRIMSDWAPFLSRERGVFLEKSVANVTRMEWLDANFDEAYFIGILRNPYAVCEGIRRQARPTRPVSDRFGQRYPIDYPARQWAASNEMLQASCRNVQRFKLVRYENFVADPVAELGALFEFLGEPLPEMSFLDGRFSMNGNTDVVRDRDSDSITRLTADELATINRVLGGVIEEHGYNALEVQPLDDPLRI